MKGIERAKRKENLSVEKVDTKRSTKNHDKKRFTENYARKGIHKSE